MRASILSPPLKQSFRRNCVPKLELGNEEHDETGEWKSIHQSLITIHFFAAARFSRMFLP